MQLQDTPAIMSYKDPPIKEHFTFTFFTICDQIWKITHMGVHEIIISFMFN